MSLRALMVVGGLSLAAFTAAEAGEKRPAPNSTNPNVQRAMKKTKKVATPVKYKPQKPQKTAKLPAPQRGEKQVPASRDLL